MAIVPSSTGRYPILNYTNKDFETIRAEMFQRLGIDPGAWTDWNESDVLVMLLELVAGSEDKLLYYIDAMANEAFLPYARQRQNVMALVKLLAYKMQTKTPSTTDVHFMHVNTGEEIFTGEPPWILTTPGSEISSIDDEYEVFIDSVELSPSVVTISIVSDEVTVDTTATVDTDATVIIRFLRVDNDADTESIIIPRHTQIATSSTPTDGGDSLTFATINSSTLTPLDASVQVQVREGIPVTETFTTDGEKNQEFALESTDVGEGTVIVTIDGEEWEEVDSFTQSQFDDQHYVVNTDHNDITTITIGDGTFGFLPAASTTVFITYLKTVGENGNIGAGTITNPVDQLFYSGGSPATVIVTNVDAATGGSARETIEFTKKNAPHFFAAQGRAVTKADYRALILTVPGVAKANAWGEQEELAAIYNAFNPPVSNYEMFSRVKFTIAPEGGGQPSQALLNDVVAFLDETRVITTFLQYISPVYVPVNIEINLFSFRDAILSNVIEDVRAVVEDYFAFENNSFGREVHRSNIIRRIDELEDVHHIELTAPIIDIEIERHEIAILGDLKIQAPPENLVGREDI